MDIKASKQKIAIYGGGRWAKVWLKILLQNTHQDLLFSIHSNGLYRDMIEWIEAQDLNKRVNVSKEAPDFLKQNYIGAVVVNAASSHKDSALSAIQANIPVLVEKPLTTSYLDTEVLIKEAKKHGAHLLTSWVFLYASYLRNFKDLIDNTTQINSITLDWFDAFSETRYGESKNYDKSIPIFMDVLPHIISILSMILGSKDIKFSQLNVDNGGSSFDLTILISGVPCNIHLKRGAADRKREIKVEAEDIYKIDFSQEPGIISLQENRIIGDIQWDSSDSPLTLMAKDFLEGIKTSKFDEKLNCNLALISSHLVDELKPIYKETLFLWFKKVILEESFEDKDLLYFILEYFSGVLDPRILRRVNNETFLKAFKSNKLKFEIIDIQNENFIYEMDKFMMSVFNTIES